MILIGLTLLICVVGKTSAEKPIFADGWYLPTADKACRLYVYELGRGKPVIVVHGGFGAEHAYLIKAVEGLTNEYHFIFYDQRGSLRSPCKLDAISFEAHVQDLDTLRSTLGLEKANIFAHSMGTMIAAQYAKEHPERMGHVVLAGALPMKSGSNLGSAYSGMLNMSAASELMSNRPEVKAEQHKIAVSEGIGPRRETHLWRIAFAAGSVYHVDRWRMVQDGGVFFASSSGNKTGQDMFRQLTNDYDFSSIFQKRSSPLQGSVFTIVSGDHDYADWENKFYSRYKDEVPLRLVIIKNAGHDAWIDAPTDFRKALRAGLGE